MLDPSFSFICLSNLFLKPLEMLAFTLHGRLLPSTINLANQYFFYILSKCAYSNFYLSIVLSSFKVYCLTLIKITIKDDDNDFHLAYRSSVPYFFFICIFNLNTPTNFGNTSFTTTHSPF